jgi:hypothetical protein
MMPFPTKDIRRRKKATVSVIEKASQLGGLGKAVEALFDKSMVLTATCLCHRMLIPVESIMRTLQRRLFFRNTTERPEV